MWIFLDFSQIFNHFYNKYYDRYYNLILMKKIYSKELKEEFKNELFESKIIPSINSIGFQIIKKGIYTNDFIIDFIINNEYYTNEKYSKYKDFSILSFFKVDEMEKKDFFLKFNNKKIYENFKENYSEYLSQFLKIILKVEYFKYFFNILPTNKYDKNTTDLIFKWLEENIYQYENKYFDEFVNGIKTYIDIMLKLKLNSKIIKLFELLKKNIGISYKNLIIYLFQTMDNIYNDEVYTYMIKYLIFPINYTPNNILEDQIYENIINFIETIKQNKTSIKILLLELAIFSIVKEDFFNESKNFDLFETLLNNEYYSLLTNENNKKSNYWKKTLLICNNLAQDLKDLNICYLDFKNTYCLLGELTVVNRIKLIFKCINENKYEALAEQINNEINKAMKIIENNLKMIENVKNYNNLINYGPSKENDKLSDYNKTIITSPLNYINSDQEYKKYENDIKKANETLPLLKSNVFLAIFKSLKSSIDGQKALELSIKKMKNIKNIFIKNEKKIVKELSNNPETIFLINIGYQSEPNLRKEINWLLNYFNIKEYDIEPLINKINIYVKNKSLSAIVSGILNLMNTFKIIQKNNKLIPEDQKFDKELNDYKNLLNIKDIISIDDIEKINKSIEEYFNINSNKKNISDFFILMNEFPDCINFLLNKKSSEINNLFEFLSESDDIIINENDLHQFMKTIKYFENFYQDNNNFETFSKFGKYIIKALLDDFLCGNCLINYIKKFNHIKLLFDRYSKHSEEFIMVIKSILKKSFIYIKQENKKDIYKLDGSFYQVNYDLKKEEIKIINYEKLKYLYERMVISKQNLSQFNSFIHFFKNINKFIDICNELYEKGYQESLTIVIKIENNNIKCFYNNYNECCSMDEILKKLIHLKEKINQTLNDYYNKSEIIRLFYGRQLYLIYDHIKTFIQNKEPKNFKGFDLFKAISNNIFQGIILNKYTINFNDLNEENKYANILEEISNFIESDLKNNSKTIKDIFDSNKILLSKKLVAGSQISKVHSKYWWKNQLEECDEYKIEFRTKESLFDEIKEEINKIHDYEVAEISSHDIIKANDDFLKWIDDNTK